MQRLHKEWLADLCSAPSSNPWSDSAAREFEGIVAHEDDTEDTRIAHRRAHSCVSSLYKPVENLDCKARSDCSKAVLSTVRSRYHYNHYNHYHYQY